MVSSIVREYKWAPSEIDALFYDAEDNHGLLFWYDDLLEMHKELKKKPE